MIKRELEKALNVPSQPKLKFVNRTSDTISLVIVNPAGHVDYYCLYLKRHQRQFIIIYTNYVQRYKIRNIFNAEEYNVYGVAVSNGAISSPSIALNISTEYSSFNIKLLRRSTNGITLGLTGIRRTTLSYSIYLNDILWKQRINTQIQNESISNFSPGTQYIVKVSVDFGKSTKNTVLKVVTNPEIPGSMTVIQSKFTIRLRFKIPSVNIDYYSVLATSVCISPTFMNVSYEVEKASNSKNEIRLITEPGACCSLNIAAVANNVSSEVQTYTVQRRETGEKSKRESIATQGPLPSTKEEMWRMIWEQNVSIVVMLTQLIERCRKKCEIYWPENVNEKMFLGEIIVEVVTISHLPNYTLRTITLQLDQYIFIHNCVEDLIGVSDDEEEEDGVEEQHEHIPNDRSGVVVEIPSTPLIKIVSQTSTSSTLQIINPAGKVRFYRIIINRNTSLPLIPYQTSNQNYNITNLKPGAHYSISAVAISNGINSSQSSEINVFTDNFSLKVKTVGRTTNSVTLEISSFDRYIKSYEIFLDGNLFKDVLHISQTQNDTIQNLVPGTLYNVKVVVTADTENKDVVFDIATLPGQPISITVLLGTNYSDITVVPPIGSVDFYTLLSSSYCLLSDIIKSSYILETIPNKKDTLRLRTEPGVCCMILVVAVSNNITSAPLNSRIKRPESVPGKVDYQYMHILENSVTIFWSIPQHPNGIVAGYTLTFWSNNEKTSIKLTCVDCPSANDCSYLSHQQMKSETFTGSTIFNDINSTISFKWRQTKFIFTIDNLQQYSNYSFTLWTSTKEGNGPAFSSSFRTVKGHTPESSCSGPVNVGAVVGSIVGTVIILVIGRLVYRWYYRRFKGNTTKPDGRSQQYEDISPETDANVYETLEIAM